MSWSNPETLTDESKRFANYDDMVAEMKSWIADSNVQLKDNDVTESTLGRFLKRSVVLRLQERDGACGTPPETETTQV